MTSSPYRILLATPDDEALIFSSWLNSYRGSEFGKKIGQQTFFYRERQRIERVLSDGKTLVLTARAHDDDSQIYGYAVATFDDYKKVTWLHFCYTKHAFRRLGIGSALLAEVVNQIPEQRYYYASYMTKPFWNWKAGQKFSFNPYFFDRIDV